jgi:hypothetical protein
MLDGPVEALEDMVDGAGLELVAFMALWVGFIGPLEELSNVVLVLAGALFAFLAAKNDLVLLLVLSSRTWRSALVA